MFDVTVQTLSIDASKHWKTNFTRKTDRNKQAYLLYKNKCVETLKTDEIKCLHLLQASFKSKLVVFLYIFVSEKVSCFSCRVLETLLH